MMELQRDLLEKSLSRVGLEVRVGQWQMMSAIADALKNKQLLGVEAPTGTGKTLAYLLAALSVKAADQTIVVSTATIALQEQLMQKDLPLVEKITGEKITGCLAKGRRRYVCHARVYDDSWQEDCFDDNTLADKLQLALEEDDWNGDYDDLPFPIDGDQWRNFSTDRDGCAGKSCAFFEDCTFFKARKKMYVADIVVVNHSLLLSDLSMGGGVVLPDPNECIYIIDECHHWPNKALDHFSHNASVMAVVDWVNSLNRHLPNLRSEKLVSEIQAELLSQLTKEVVTTATQIRDVLALNSECFDDGLWRIVDVPESLLPLADAMARACQQIADHTQAIDDAAQAKLAGAGLDAEQRSELARHATAVAFACSRAINQYETWRALCYQRQGKEAPLAKWITQTETGYVCHVAPIYVGDVLDKQCWQRFTEGAVLCSATMSALGSLDYFSRRAGLKGHKRYSALQIPSQFDFTQSILHVPKMNYAPVGAEMAKHEREFVDLLPKLIGAKGGSLVLFTSRRAMLATYDALPDSLQLDIILQKGQSKSKLVTQHKNRVRANRRSILFGLASFGEGLDLPADFCQHVIIHKLPFSVPSTPTELTRSEWLQANKLNPFMMSTLPQASMQLTQYVGRLVRQATDRGVVTICDKRLYTKPYGKQLLSNLPDFVRMVDVPMPEFETKGRELDLV